MLKETIVRILLCLVVTLSLSATGAMGANILYITADPTGATYPNDALIKTFLEGLGHTVTYFDDNEDEPAMETAAAAADLVYISESVSSSNVRDKITEIETPMIVGEPYAWDEMGLTSGGGGVSEVVSTNITIVNPGHFLAAGLSGTVPVLTGIGEIEIARFGTGIAGGQASVIATATLSDDQTYDVIIVYEKGAELAVAPNDGSPQIAADMRICMFFDYIAQPLLNENAYKLLAAAVNYALGMTVQAGSPNPPDGAENVSTPLLQWSTGYTANWHNVYLGTNPTPGAAELVSERQTDTMYEHAAGLTPSTTYYWRIDEIEVDGTTTYTGVVWSFKTAPLTASNPSPPDGAIYMDLNTTLDWDAGYGSVTHDLYFGTVNPPPFVHNQSATAYDPGPLVKGATYYWRIDGVEADGTTKHPGVIWSFSTLPDIPIRDTHLVGWWKLDDEGTGIATDYSGHDNHGTLVGDLQWVAGFDGEGLEFDGAGYVDLPTGLIGTDKGSVTMWIKTTQGDQGHIFYGSEGTSGDGFGGQNEFHVNVRSNGGIEFFLEGGDAGDVRATTSAINDDTWLHVAATWDINGEMKLYLDGSETDSESHNGNNFNLAGRIRLGAPNDSERQYIGLLDDLRLYDYELSVDEIAKTMKGDTRLASNPNPANGSTPDIEHATSLSWTPGDSAAKHDVYFGTDREAVTNADATDTSGVYRIRLNLGEESYDPQDVLEFGQTYFWRIDEYNTDATIDKGKVWRFTLANYLVVDDMEAYNYTDNLIWHAWKDGEGWTEPLPGWGGNGSGSVMDIGTDFVQDAQSLAYSFDNDGTNSLGTTGKAFYSEAKMTLSNLRDWTAQGVKALSLLFRGYPAYLGGFVEAPPGVYTMTGAGTDIWDNFDEFHFAYKELNGAGTIIAKVESVENTHEFAKAGVMIRDTLDPNSANAALLITPENGVRFQYRNAIGDNTDRFFDDTITAPQWVKLERTIGGMVRAYYSPDGNSWEQFDLLSTVTMNLPMYIGLAVTSHDANVKCVAEFSNVSFPDTTVGTEWTHKDIGIISNDAESMYVAISNNNGTTGTVYYDDNDNKDPNATLIDTWTEWNIDLKDFSDQGVNLNDVNDIAIGFGTKGNMTTPGGSGQMYIDNVRLYQPRYVPDKVTPFAADFTDDGLVDFYDLEIMTNDWLQGDYTIYAETPQPASASWEFENNVNGTSGNNGVAYGSPTYGTGKFNQAIIFDGTDDYVVVTDSPEIEFTTGSFSISLWVKSNYVAGSDKQFIVCNGTNGTEFDAGGNGPNGRSTGKRYVIKFEGSNFQLLVDDDSTKTTIDGASSKFATGDWVHAVVMSDAEAKELRVYCNGELQSSKANATASDISSPGEPLYIGAKQREDAHAANSASAPIDHYFEGMLDDLHIYDYALSQAEILGVIGSDLYVPLTSSANISDEEPANSKKVNFKDFAILADEWLEERVWPEW
ncbi:MAG: LamG-like jellyroll fold domain-containing protein [Planctomycetota bacterium]|jgi:hypothetical protein